MDKLEDRNVRLGAQFSACSIRGRPWGLGIKCLAMVLVLPFWQCPAVLHLPL